MNETEETEEPEKSELEGMSFAGMALTLLERWRDEALALASEYKTRYTDDAPEIEARYAADLAVIGSRFPGLLEAQGAGGKTPTSAEPVVTVSERRDLVCSECDRKTKWLADGTCAFCRMRHKLDLDRLPPRAPRDPLRLGLESYAAPQDSDYARRLAKGPPSHGATPLNPAP